jgi:anti-anti-sigma factor
MLDISTKDHSDRLSVVSITGRLDAASAEVADEALRQVLDRGVTRLVIDLSGVKYISSGGLRTVLAAAKRTKAAGGQTRVSGAESGVREVFDLSGLSQFIPLDADVTAALAALST